jgi:DNA invertase Pin-like site-specific DNA recombinase
LPWCFDKGIRPALREYCARQKWSITSEYVDHETGGTSRRKHFQQMMTDASMRKFDALVVWALDRLTREGVAETFEHIKRLRSHGVEFISYREEHFRTIGPAGELMIAVAAWQGPSVAVLPH